MFTSRKAAKKRKEAQRVQKNNYSLAILAKKLATLAVPHLPSSDFLTYLYALYG